MATTKKEYSSTDAQPVVLYGLQAASSVNAVPILATANGAMVVSGGGFDIPAYDYISFTPALNPTVVLYKSGGSGGATVRTLTLTYSGNDVASMTAT